MLSSHETSACLVLLLCRLHFERDASVWRRIIMTYLLFWCGADPFLWDPQWLDKTHLFLAPSYPMKAPRRYNFKSQQQLPGPSKRGSHSVWPAAQPHLHQRYGTGSTPQHSNYPDQ
jgi:hypothetical protein